MTAYLVAIVRISFWGAILAAVIISAKKLAGKRLPATFHYAVWAILLLHLFIPVTLEIPHTPDFTEIQEAVAMPIVQSIKEPNLQEAVDEHEISGSYLANTAQHRGFSWTFALMIGYWSGLIVYAAVMLYGHIRFRKQLKDLPVPKCTTAIFEQEKNKCHRTRNARLRVAGTGSPFVYGLFRPTIVLTPEVAEADAQEDTLRAVFRHELTHIAYGDICVRALLVVLQGIHWFNPILWYSFAAIRRDSEYACDERVIRRETEAERYVYGNALIFTAEQCPMKSTNIISFASPPIKERISQIFHYRHTRRFAAVTAILVMGVIGCAAVLLGSHIVDHSAGNWERRQDGIYVSFANESDMHKINLPSDQRTVILQDNTSLAAYIGRDKLVLVYDTPFGNAVMLCSANGGKKWTETGLRTESAEPLEFTNAWIGFSSKQEGWLVSGLSASGKTEDHRIFLSHDGGSTWTETDAPDKQRNYMLSCAAFADAKRGYLCFSSEKHMPDVYYTEDGGQNWNKIELPLVPDKYFSYDIMNICFKDSYGIMEVNVTESINGNTNIYSIYLSCMLSIKNGGEYWRFGLPINLLKATQISIQSDLERIGIEYEFSGTTSSEQADSHGWVKGFSQTINENEWEVSFDEMHSTVLAETIYHTGQTLQIQSTVDSDKVWIKITDSEGKKIQKFLVKSGETQNVDLSAWTPGRLIIWLVVDSKTGGTITVKSDSHFQK